MRLQISLSRHREVRSPESDGISSLADRYQACRQAIARASCQDAPAADSDAIWDEIQEIVEAVAASRARSIRDLRLKLAMALDMTEESDPFRFLFLSLAEDLAGQETEARQAPIS